MVVMDEVVWEEVGEAGMDAGRLLLGWVVTAVDMSFVGLRTVIRF
jgi:hypothetical protein